jgi:hypothetical protein
MPRLRLSFVLFCSRAHYFEPATPADGTYAYFRRVHPFMGGAFRVKG